MEKFKKTLLPLLFLIWGLFFQGYITKHLTILPEDWSVRVTFVAKAVLLEGFIFFHLYIFLKKDIFFIETYKKTKKHSGKWIFKKMNQLEEHMKTIVSTPWRLLTYVCFFVIIAAPAGPVVTTLLFRNVKPDQYSGFWNKETILYFLLSCSISVVFKFVTLGHIVWIIWDFISDNPVFTFSILLIILFVHKFQKGKVE